MRNSPTLHRQIYDIVGGVRAAVLLVVLVGLAVAVDQGPVPPYETAVLAHAVSAAIEVRAGAQPVVILPQLRAHEGEVPAPLATF